MASIPFVTSSSIENHVPGIQPSMTCNRQIPLMFSRKYYPAWLLGSVIVWAGMWSMNPLHPDDFLIEHILTVIFLGILIGTYRFFPFSNFSYSLIAAFIGLHALGAHYTYSEVPYEDWFQHAASWIGISDFSVNDLFGFERNQFDRLVHFSFGILLVLPLREWCIRWGGLSPGWSTSMAFMVIQACSMFYEILEWMVALLMSDGVSQSYLGTQGDIWDAQKDMAIAALGSFLALGTTLAVEAFHKRSIRNRT